MKEPLVYIILVNYNGLEDTKECIQSLLNIKYSNYRIIVVDNASKDAENFKSDEFFNENVHVIYSNKNGGFSYGNNIGIRFAINQNADYVLLLNNDTTVEPNFLSELLKTAHSRENIGIITGDIKCYYEKERKWYSCGSYDRKTGVTHPINEPKKRDNAQRVSFASGCLMLISTECIKNCGVLEEKFFMYSEDTEYCLRCDDQGYEVWWNPNAIIYHKAGQSVGNKNYIQGYYMIRNNLHVAKQYVTNKLYAYLVRLIISIMDAKKGNINWNAVVDGYRDFMRGIVGKNER